MKRVAALILNRNLPHLADELGAWISEHHGSVVDLHVIENGSDPDKRSRYATILLPESLGPSGGINEGLRRLMDQGYDYFWINYNDARYTTAGFLDRALDLMDADPQIGIVFPWWKDNIWVYGKRGRNDLVTFSAILGFVVNRQALTIIADHPHFRFGPLWDSSNFSNHDNIIATLLALYEGHLCAVTDRQFTVTELTDPADAASATARGFSAEAWKHTKGPADVEAWYERAFPELTGTYKEKRALVMKRIERLIRTRHRGSVSLRASLHRWFQKARTKAHGALSHL